MNTQQRLCTIYSDPRLVKKYVKIKKKKSNKCFGSQSIRTVDRARTFSLIFMKFFFLVCERSVDDNRKSISIVECVIKVPLIIFLVIFRLNYDSFIVSEYCEFVMHAATGYIPIESQSNKAYVLCDLFLSHCNTN